MQMYKCNRCNCFVDDQGYFEIEYYDKNMDLVGRRVTFKGNLCTDCGKSAIDIIKAFLMKEGEGE